jgi:hypothetical protein
MMQITYLKDSFCTETKLPQVKLNNYKPHHTVDGTTYSTYNRKKGTWVTHRRGWAGYHQPGCLNPINSSGTEDESQCPFLGALPSFTSTKGDPICQCNGHQNLSTQVTMCSGNRNSRSKNNGVIDKLISNYINHGKLGYITAEEEK